MRAGSKSNIILYPAARLLVLLFCFLQIGRPAMLYADLSGEISPLIGKKDSVIVASPQGRILFEKNVEKRLIPASTLKIFTALVAFHYLGPLYRFPTEFYLDQNNHLIIRGYGDPLLISETLQNIAEALSGKLSGINDLVLDNSYFLHPTRIPGTTISSFQPYDAPNSALSVNFNTVNFKRTNNSYVSAEDQTPLLPFVLRQIKASTLDHGRIVLSSYKDESTLYAGHLFRYFLAQKGITVSGKIKIGRVKQHNGRLLLKYTSPFSLEQVIAKMLEFSNNFIANQILLAAGAKAYGPPGTLAKGVKSAFTYADRALKTGAFSFVEGSGISRKNRISAKIMFKILNNFEAYHHLMRHRGLEYYKTGTLAGVMTRAGYLANRQGGLYPFVLIINTPGKSTRPAMERIRRFVELHQKAQPP